MYIIVPCTNVSVYQLMYQPSFPLIRFLHVAMDQTYQTLVPPRLHGTPQMTSRSASRGVSSSDDDDNQPTMFFSLLMEAA